MNRAVDAARFCFLVGGEEIYIYVDFGRELSPFGERKKVARSSIIESVQGTSPENKK